jgi:flagellar basal-body rod protein FlgB
MIPANSQVALLARLMDAACLRNEVIAQNVANVNTPGHECLTVQFEDALAQALASGDTAQAMHVTPVVVPGGGGTMRADGNNVDIDLELGRLQKNSLLFEFYAQVMSLEVGQYRSAIQGR